MLSEFNPLDLMETYELCEQEYSDNPDLIQFIRKISYFKLLLAMSNKQSYTADEKRRLVDIQLKLCRI